MPDFTISISDTAAAKVAALVTRYNENNGTNFTVKEWITLHLRELAIQEELLAAVETAKQQLEKDTQTAVINERQRLLAENL